MAKKKENPSHEQAKIIEKNGLNKLTWMVLQDLNHEMIVKHRITGECRVIPK